LGPRIPTPWKEPVWRRRSSYPKNLRLRRQTLLDGARGLAGSPGQFAAPPSL
jgi:hypothetical protein